MHTHENHINFWQLQDAKARLSELVKTTLSEGPQGISVRGVPEVIVISIREYEKLTTSSQNAWQFFRDSPLVGVDLDLERDKSANRDVDL